MKSEKYPEGIDCVWLGSDCKGHLGAFITAGMGPIPLMALNSSMVPIEEIEGRLCELPVLSKVKLLISPERPDDYIDLAERGFFVYDWTDVRRTLRDELKVYELVAAPETPMAIESLPHDLQAVAKNLMLLDINFPANNSLEVRVFINCVDAHSRE